MKEYQDHYFRKAKQENYPARSVYKLQEIDAKFHLLRPGMRLLDLGASPGSWTLWASRRVGTHGSVFACDLNPLTIALPDNVRFFQEDVFTRTQAFEEQLCAQAPFDGILSDMAPKTTGSVFTDQARSHNLALEAYAVAKRYLRRQGAFVVKIFMGPDVESYLKTLKQDFASVKTFKPKSSRSESKETFIIGMDFCGNGSAQDHA
ncbi:MAG: RlmE family RNA methyltransferase [Desulfovibrio sp.]|nr:RlmE family RNA methyltransferase [Desulfovibrio sp.]